MIIRRGKINKKEQQYAGGNWGHPRKYVKKHTEIANPLGPDIEKRPPSKKKDKKKTVAPKKYWNVYDRCPFCEEELQKIEKKPIEVAGKLFSVFPNREKFCRKCGACEVKECPACKHSTWYRDEIYKHLFYGCGFSGKKLQLK